MVYTTLCLSSGSINGIAFIGILEYLEKINYINMLSFESYVGTSCGAILCFLFSIGYSLSEIKYFILHFNLNLLKESLFSNILNLWYNCSIYSGTKLIYLFSQLLNNKLNMVDITFLEHYEITHTKLNIIGTNLNKNREVLFNYEKTPNMSVILALRITCSIPFIFTPVQYNDEVYVDGAIVNHFPIKYCDIETTLGIILKVKFTMPCTSFKTYIKKYISLIINANGSLDYKHKHKNIIELCIKLNNIIDIFNITYHDKLKLIKYGKLYTIKFLNKYFNE